MGNLQYLASKVLLGAAVGTLLSDHSQFPHARQRPNSDGSLAKSYFPPASKVPENPYVSTFRRVYINSVEETRSVSIVSSGPAPELRCFEFKDPAVVEAWNREVSKGAYNMLAWGQQMDLLAAYSVLECSTQFKSYQKSEQQFIFDLLGGLCLYGGAKGAACLVDRIIDGGPALFSKDAKSGRPLIDYLCSLYRDPLMAPLAERRLELLASLAKSIGEPEYTLQGQTRACSAGALETYLKFTAPAELSRLVYEWATKGSTELISGARSELYLAGLHPRPGDYRSLASRIFQTSAMSFAWSGRYDYANDVGYSDNGNRIGPGSFNAVVNMYANFIGTDTTQMFWLKDKAWDSMSDAEIVLNQFAKPVFQRLYRGKPTLVVVGQGIERHMVCALDIVKTAEGRRVRVQNTARPFSVGAHEVFNGAMMPLAGNSESQLSLYTPKQFREWMTGAYIPPPGGIGADSK